MTYIWHKIKQRLFSGIRVATDWIVFIAIVVAGGVGSSWYMVEAGNRLTTETFGPWVTWTAKARTDADPYTRAHFARNDMLDLSTDVAASYYAYGDNDGNVFTSSCTYVVESGTLDAAWWSLTVFDTDGRLIPNAANRYVFSATTTALAPDGSFKVNLARDAKPHNWLPTGNAGRFILVLHMLNPADSIQNDGDQAVSFELPDIRQVGCG